MPGAVSCRRARAQSSAQPTRTPILNDLVDLLGLQSWKPLVSVLLLPPVPLLLLVLIGARLMFSRRVLAWLCLLLACTLLWLSTTTAAGKLLRQSLMTLPPPLSAQAIAGLKKSAGEAPRTAIVVLGAGRWQLAPEYGLSTLTPLSVERLRYGLWLGRETGLPVAYSGGVGHGARGQATEAEAAARIAEREFGRPLRWTEDRSRDTAENGLLTVPMLHAAGIRRIVLVTSDAHQPRALRAFERGARHAGVTVELLPAPIGVPVAHEWSASDFLPSAQGFQDTRIVLHEWMGYWLGA